MWRDMEFDEIIRLRYKNSVAKNVIETWVGLMCDWFKLQGAMSDSWQWDQ